MNSAKAELLGVRKLCVKIYHLYREKESLLGITRNIKSDEKVQTSTGSGGLEATVLERDRIQKEIDKAMSLYISERQQIIDRIHRIDKEEYIQVLYKRHIEGKSFEAIKREMHYEVSYLRKLHSKALNAYIKTM